MLRTLLFLPLAFYPFLVYFGLDRLGPQALGVILGAVLLLRLAAGGPLGLPRGALLPIGATLAFVIAVLVTGDALTLKSYPVFVSLGLLALFAWSLWRPPTIIERGLRLGGRDVPEHARSYLWWVTLAWCAFFLLNAAVAAWTAYAAPLSWWTLYNGLLSYLCIALLFGMELVVRGFYRRRMESRGAAAG